MEDPTDRMPRVTARSGKKSARRAGLPTGAASKGSKKKKEKSPCASIRRMKGESEDMFMKRKKKTCKQMKRKRRSRRDEVPPKKTDQMETAPISVSTSTTTLVQPPAMKPKGISYATTRHHRVPDIDITPTQKIGASGQQWTINYPEQQPYREGGTMTGGGFTTDPHQTPSNVQVDKSNALYNSYGVLGDQGVTPQYHDHASSHEFVKTLHHEIIDRPYGAPAVLNPVSGPSLKPIELTKEEKARIGPQDIDLIFSSTDTSGSTGRDFSVPDIFNRGAVGDRRSKPSVPFSTSFGSTLSM